MKRFYTGKSCRYGHDAQRFVTTGGCVECNAQRSRAFRRPPGAFVYDLHPDDHAAALAYCQALDMQRGRAPNAPAPAVPAPPLVLPADLARHRASIIQAHGPDRGALESYIPREMRGT